MGSISGPGRLHMPGATKPVCHSYCGPEMPLRWEAHVPRGRVAHTDCNQLKPVQSNEDPTPSKINKWMSLKKDSDDNFHVTDILSIIKIIWLFFRRDTIPPRHNIPRSSWAERQEQGHTTQRLAYNRCPVTICGTRGGKDYRQEGRGYREAQRGILLRGEERWVVEKRSLEPYSQTVGLTKSENSGYHISFKTLGKLPLSLSFLTCKKAKIPTP